MEKSIQMSGTILRDTFSMADIGSNKLPGRSFTENNVRNVHYLGSRNRFYFFIACLKKEMTSLSPLTASINLLGFGFCLLTAFNIDGPEKMVMSIISFSFLLMKLYHTWQRARITRIEADKEQFELDVKKYEHEQSKTK